MKKMTKRIALALSLVLFALAFTACGPNLLYGGDDDDYTFSLEAFNDCLLYTSRCV